MWRILVGDDAVAIDKGIRSMELGDMYPLEDHQDPNDAFNDDWLARKGDPTWYSGRQTQLAARAKSKL